MRTALITGAATRIGRALAIALAADGYDIHVHCRNSLDEAHQLADEIRMMGRRAAVLQADFADFEQAAVLLQQCIAFGPITCLINNAALYERDDIADFEAARFDRHMAVNLRAPLILASAFAAQLPVGQSGTILNMLDFKIAALPAKFLSYTASKAGLAAATEMLALALAPRIRVNAIAPGLVLTSDHETGSAFDRLRAATPLQRGVEIADIVDAARYLLTASSVTGQTIMVDSGQRFVSKRYL